MTSQEQQVVERVVEQLTQSFMIRRIILFGSRARGDADTDSDYDFLVVMDTEVKPSRRGIEVRKKGLIPGIPMDFMVRTPEEWDRGFPLKKEIISEGMIVFEKRDPDVAHQGA